MIETNIYLLKIKKLQIKNKYINDKIYSLKKDNNNSLIMEYYILINHNNLEIEKINNKIYSPSDLSKIPCSTYTIIYSN
mgnify:CR=1 FL=1